MIKLYYGLTPNAFKVTIALEEMGIDYTTIAIAVQKGEQYSNKYSRVNPNHKIPAMVDTAPKEGGEPITVFESGAILLYLAEKSECFMPQSLVDRYEVMQWLMWQMAGFGPMLGQAHHFLQYAPEQVPYAKQRYATEARRLYGVLNQHLTDREFIGSEYSIADMACWPWVYFRNMQDISLVDFPAVKRWYDGIASRSAVQKAMAGLVVQPAPLSKEEQTILFGLTAE